MKRTNFLSQHRLSEAEAFSRNVEGYLAFIEGLRPKMLERWSEEEIAEVIESVKRKGCGTVPAKWQLQLVTFLNLQEWVDRIYRMYWRVEVVHPGKEFVTSDNPVYVRRRGHPRDPAVVGIDRADLDAELYVAISRNRFLICSWKKPEHLIGQRGSLSAEASISTRTISPGRVDELNELTVLMSDKYVYSSRQLVDIEALVERCSDFRLELPKLSEV